jgi:hypothetical protein
MAKIKLKVSPKTGDPVSPKPVDDKLLFSPNRSQAQLDFDVRDRISELVGKGNALLPDDKMAIFSNLSSVLGKDRAQKVMDHAYLFNTRPEVQRLPLEEKIKSFYTVGSNDPWVHEVIQKTKSLGYGPVEGMRSSHSTGNQQLTGAMPVVAAAATSPVLKKKVMITVKK